MKDYYAKWEWRLWTSDPALSMCQPATRGIWMDALCAMMEQGTDRLAGSVEQLARVCRCSAAEMEAAIADLEANNAASVESKPLANGQQNVSKILVCRRLSRELEIKQLRSEAGAHGASKRQANAKQTHKQSVSKPLTITLTTDSSLSSDNGKPPPNGPDSWTVEQFVSAARQVGTTEAEARACFAHYSVQGWVLGNNRPIALTATPATVLSRWTAKGATLSGKPETSAENERRKAEAEKYL